MTVERLSRAYGRTQALAGVSLTVRPGEVVGLVGANGAGKSSAIRIAMGLLGTDSGTVSRQGRALTFAARQRFGYSPEERGLYPKMRAIDQVAYFGRGCTTAAVACASRGSKSADVIAASFATSQTTTRGARSAPGRREVTAGGQPTMRTPSACGPLGPWTTSNSTRWFSSSER